MSLWLDVGQPMRKTGVGKPVETVICPFLLFVIVARPGVIVFSESPNDVWDPIRFASVSTEVCRLA